MPIPKHGRNPPSESTPVRGLLIVARDHADVYHALEQAFGGSQQVTVLFDRRHQERRRAVRPVESDLRRIERRSFPHLEEDLRLRKYVLVRPHYRRPHD